MVQTRNACIESNGLFLQRLLIKSDFCGEPVKKMLKNHLLTSIFFIKNIREKCLFPSKRERDLFEGVGSRPERINDKGEKN